MVLENILTIFNKSYFKGILLNPLNLKVIYTYTEMCIYIYIYISWSHSILPTYFDVMSQRFLSIFFLFIFLNLVCRKCIVPRRYLIIIISHYLIPSFRSEISLHLIIIHFYSCKLFFEISSDRWSKFLQNFPRYIFDSKNLI